MKFVILYGWYGSAQANWFPWLKNELEKLGHEVIIPDLPHSDKPQLAEWLPELNKLLLNEKDEIVLIGHSLGAVLILHYLQQDEVPLAVKAAILVSGWGEDDGHLEPEIANFFPTPFDYGKIRNNAHSMALIASTNDPYIYKETFVNFARDLGVTPGWVENGGHLTSEDGFAKFPLLLEVVARVIK